MLTHDSASAQLRWAIEHLAWERSRWSKIIWSNECLVERSTGKRPSYIFCTLQQKWDKDKIDTYKKDKGHTVMVWASFSGALGASDLVVMKRDKEAPKGGYSVKSYIKVLEDQIL